MRPKCNLIDTDEQADVEVRAPGHTAALFEHPAKFRQIVLFVARAMKQGKYDAIAGSGHSGLLLVGAVAARIGCRMIAVRKDDERPKGDSRSVNAALPRHGAVRYLFVDDFMCTGETLKRVELHVKSAFPNAVMAGAAFYRRGIDRAEDVRREVASYLGEERARNIRIHCVKNPYSRTGA